MTGSEDQHSDRPSTPRAWLESVLPHHERLTESVVTVIRGILTQRRVDYLSVTGRTKDPKSAFEKITRKGYRNPARDMTDLSGIRVIVFIESDIEKASKIIEDAFRVDQDNSSNKDTSLSSDQVGYRSVHYVCDLGKTRESLPENSGLAGLKFEVQIRTVLQHAWAELHHDRAYKFQSRLPEKIQRELYLHAGLLEIADKGFSGIARKIDDYVANLAGKISEGDLSSTLNSLSLHQFVANWCEKNDVLLLTTPTSLEINDLLHELKQFGIQDLQDLEAIIPNRYAKCAHNVRDNHMNIFGIVRDWMTMSDPEKLYETVNPNWIKAWDLDSGSERPLFKCVMGDKGVKELENFIARYGPSNDPD